jgi:uncharacterized phosphosugar-binding protein
MNRADCYRIAVLSIFLGLCSCEDSDSREIAGGYRLKRTGDSKQLALTIPYKSGGLIVDEIGWSEPIILARASGSSYWEAINTARAQRLAITESQRHSDPVYQSIPVEAAESAWAKLNRRKRLW